MSKTTSNTPLKRKLKLPKDFSFSPQEIAMFITATPHGTHKIDFERALGVFQILALNQTYRYEGLSL